MSNSYFRFKHFTIHQDKCAMKVCTDACIFGALFAEKKLGDRILDIGSGTGLLMLMLAQKQQAHIEGIEIDSGCFHQLQQNIAQSQWKKKFKLHHGDIRTFQTENKYDFVISNPPFHENNLNSPSLATNLARHSVELRLEELIKEIDRLISDDGTFAVLLPYYRSEYFEALAQEKHFYLLEKLLIRQSPNHKYFRSILYYSKVPKHEPSSSELLIQNESREYTNEFIQLLNDYYLYLPD